MNKGDIPRIVRVGDRVSERLTNQGRAAWEATHDWQSPLRSAAAGPRGKGGHGDPAGAAAVASVLGETPAAMRYHAELIAALEAKSKADNTLLSLLHRIEAIDPAKVERGRVSTDAGCIVCGGPAPVGHRRSGKCDACRKAWDRAGRPPLEDFRRQRAREQAAAAVRLHEHDRV